MIVHLIDECFFGNLDQRKKKLESMEREDDLDTVVAKLVDQAANFNIQRFHCAIEIKVKSHTLNLFIFVFMSFSSLFGVGIQVFKELNLFMKAVVYIYR